MNPSSPSRLILLLLISSAASATAAVWEEQFASEPVWAADSISPTITDDVTPGGTKFIRGGGRVNHQTTSGFGDSTSIRLRPSDAPAGETRGFAILLDSTILTPGSYTLSYYLSTNASPEPEDYVHASVWEADSSGGSGSYTINVMPGVSTPPSVDAGTATPGLLGSKQTTLPDNTAYTLQSFEFNHTGGDVILMFATIEGNAGGDGQDTYFLDNIQITAPDPPTPSTQPNLVFLFSDDAGYQDFGFQDQLTGQTTGFLTPNLDQLAQQSILCRAGYVSASVCSPSRAGLLSGRMQNRFGYEGNVANTNDPNDGMPLDEKLIFERLGELGYQIGVVGKWHIGRHLSKQPKQRGVDYFYGFWGGSRAYFGTESLEENKLRDIDGNWRSNWINESSYNGIAPDPSLGRHLTDAFGDAACEFINAQANTGQPFFSTSRSAAHTGPTISRRPTISPSSRDTPHGPQTTGTPPPSSTPWIGRSATSSPPSRTRTTTATPPTRSPTTPSSSSPTTTAVRPTRTMRTAISHSTEARFTLRGRSSRSFYRPHPRSGKSRPIPRRRLCQCNQHPRHLSDLRRGRRRHRRETDRRRQYTAPPDRRKHEPSA